MTNSFGKHVKLFSTTLYMTEQEQNNKLRKIVKINYKP